jgi:ribonuclease HII
MRALRVTGAAAPARVVCGLDEVGRGALAGPLFAAAVVLPRGFRRRAGEVAPLIRDSKTLTPRQRERADEVIRALALAWRIEVVAAAEINRCGIGWANREAFHRLMASVPAEEYVVDGNLRLQAPPEGRVRSLPGADASVPAVSAASVIAKVARDRFMRDLHHRFPHYAWDRNVGYGTREHVRAIREHGLCEEHRLAFVRSITAPMAQLAWPFVDGGEGPRRAPDAQDAGPADRAGEARA